MKRCLECNFSATNLNDLKIMYKNVSYMILWLLDGPVVVWVAGPAHGSILVASPALARHWSVQRGVEMGGRVGPGIPNRVHHVKIFFYRLKS